jgi:hypothetical protein
MVEPTNIIVDLILSSRSVSHRFKIKNRHEVIGNHIMEIGSLPLDEFEEYIGTLLLKRLSNDITSLEDKLHLFGEQPAYWSIDVKKRVETLSQVMANNPLLAMKNLLGYKANKPGNGGEIIQTIIYKFGELLHWWPQIISATKTLRDRGIRLGQSM